MKYILISIIIIISNINFLYSKEINNYYNIKYIDNYDGDTLTTEITVFKKGKTEFIVKDDVRIKNINTKEINSKDIKDKEQAMKSKEKLKNILIKSNKIDLLNCSREKYGRLLCDINIDGKDLKEIINYN